MGRMGYSDTPAGPGPSKGQVVSYTFLTIFIILFILAALVGSAFGCKAYNRYQARADANNRVQVSEIEIRNQVQRVKIAQQEAEIKHQIAIGQRKANEEIALKLTPLFVQYEMAHVLQEIAKSGNNNSVVYIPSGAHGVPLVSVANQPQVYQGDPQPKE